jgi:hypothetical protein
MIKFINAFDRYNWIDDRNNFVGYKSEEKCCEQFGYYWVKKEANKDPSKGYIASYERVFGHTIEEYYDLHFDFSYNEKDKQNEDELYYIKKLCPRIDFIYFEGEDHSTFNMKIFSTSIDDYAKFFLVLYNYHNEYYYHDWSASSLKEEGIL